MEKEVTQLSEETSETNTQKPKKERRLKRIFKGIKKRKKKILLIILGLIIAGSIIGFMAYDQYNQRNNSEPIVFETQPQKLSMSGWIVSVYDGDLTVKPSISIYNRVIKVTARMKLSQDKTVNLTTRDQVKLVSKGSSYSPLFLSTKTLNKDEQNFDFYFELNRDLMPEALIIKHETIESSLEMLIDRKNNYTTNTNLNLVFDDNSNEEYVELKDKLTSLVSDPQRLFHQNLPNIDLVISTPQNIAIKYYESVKKTDYKGPEEYNPYYSVGQCFGINAETLQPTTDSTDCQYYAINYTVDTDSRLLGISRSISIYRNSYPRELVGILDSHDSLKKFDVTLFNQKLSLIEIDSSGSKTTYMIGKADSGDVFVFLTSKYSGYQSQIPAEIIDLEAKLLLKVLESTKYELQEDIVEVTPSSKIPEEKAPVSYTL